MTCRFPPPQTVRRLPETHPHLRVDRRQALRPALPGGLARRSVRHPHGGGVAGCARAGVREGQGGPAV
ncbi:MAG: hypothetical protein MZV64_00350 [Ignavibacteriales bacterium]|nr:hypothetical protein [Ignavibacteriales bacterium]